MTANSTEFKCDHMNNFFLLRNFEMAGDLILPVRDSEDERHSSTKAVDAMAIRRLTLCSNISLMDGPRKTNKKSMDRAWMEEGWES